MKIGWLTSLRGRLIASYVLTLVLAMLLFGSLAVLLIDRDLRASQDARLRTTAQAALNFIDTKSGAVEIEKDDRERLLAMLGSQTSLAVLSRSQLLFSTAVKTVPQVLAAGSMPPGFLAVNDSGADIRVLLLPIDYHGKRIGTIAAWAPTDWIEETDLRVAAAFAGAALVLALVAALTSTAATRRALEDAFARQRRFAADASHELRAPLSVIRAEADLALRRPRDTAEYQTALRTIAAETDEIEKLVGGLLAAVRAQDGRARRGFVDVSSLAQRVCARLRPAAEAKQVNIICELAEHCQAMCDAGAVERAVTAVVDNAIKYCSPGGTIRVTTARGRRGVELSIRDSGPGFSLQALAHGTEWFWRGEDTTADKGTGLGLAITNQVVQASGGNLALRNAPSGGAEVLIALPAR